VSKKHRVKIDGAKYRAIVLQVAERDELGRPLLVRILGEQESVRIQGGEEFFIVYAEEGKGLASRREPVRKGEA
jgi:hypothetical protein